MCSGWTGILGSSRVTPAAVSSRELPAAWYAGFRPWFCFTCFVWKSPGQNGRGPLETEVGSLEQVLNLAKTACDRQDGSLCIILNSSMKPHMQPRRSHRLSWVLCRWPPEKWIQHDPYIYKSSVSMKMLGCASVSFEDWIFPVRSRPQGSLSSTWSVWRSCDCAQSVPAASRGRLLGTGQQYHKKKQHGHFKVIASRKKMQNSFNWQLWILPFLDSFGGCLGGLPWPVIFKHLNCLVLDVDPQPTRFSRLFRGFPPKNTCKMQNSGGGTRQVCGANHGYLMLSGVCFDVSSKPAQRHLQVVICSNFRDAPPQFNLPRQIILHSYLKIS